MWRWVGPEIRRGIPQLECSDLSQPELHWLCGMLATCESASFPSALLPSPPIPSHPLPSHLISQDTTGPALYMLLRATKSQLDKGPVDVVTGEARYSLSERTILRSLIDNYQVGVANGRGQ